MLGKRTVENSLFGLKKLSTTKIGVLFAVWRRKRLFL
jgi:hypothetical protein